MSQINVSYGLRNVKIKTTPGMLLNDVLQKAASVFQLKDITQLSLKHSNAVLDLSLPIRLSALPQGAKLTIIKSSKKNATSSKQITIKLQIIGNDVIPSSISPSSLTSTFESSTTIWSILKYFEIRNNGEINLTTRAVPIKGSDNFLYEKPIVQTLSVLIKELDDLNKPLSSFGMNGGNSVLRVRFEKTDILFNNVFEKYPLLFSSSPNTLTAQTKVVEEKKIETETTPIVKELTKPESPPKDKTPLEEHKQQEISTNDNNINIKTEKEDVVMEDASPDPRKVIVYKASKEPVVPDEQKEDYELTVSQAKQYQNLLANRAGSGNGPLLTKNLREKAKPEKKHQIKSCEVRIRFPGQNLLHATFRPNETVGDIISFIKSSINYPDKRFNLNLNFPRINLIDLDPSSQLVKDCKFSNRTMLTFTWDKENNNIDDIKTNILKDEILKGAKDITESKDVALDRNVQYYKDGEDNTPESSTKKETKNTNTIFSGSVLRSGGAKNTKSIPKWFKMGKGK